MLVFGGNRIGNSPSIAQGPKSKELKFNSYICEICNTNTTQASDFAYSYFLQKISSINADSEAQDFAQNELQRIESIDIFRYFAKLLGCQLAEMGAPIPKRLIHFVSRKKSSNCIFLQIRPDPRYTYITGLFNEGNIPYTAHGGVAATISKNCKSPKRIFSSYSVNKVQFVFHIRLHYIESIELRVFNRDFVSLCRKQAQAAETDPDMQADLNQIGLL